MKRNKKKMAKSIVTLHNLRAKFVEYGRIAVNKWIVCMRFAKTFTMKRHRKENK